MIQLTPALAVVLLFGAVPFAVMAGPGTTQPESAAAVLKDLQEATRDKGCDDTSQCRSLALGARACGGPERYLPWSIRRSDPAHVAALSERYSAARRAENQRESRVSNCAYLMDPGAVCVAGQCVPQSTDIIR